MVHVNQKMQGASDEQVKTIVSGAHSDAKIEDLNAEQVEHRLRKMEKSVTTSVSYA